MDTASIIVVSLLLYIASKPMLQGGSKLTEAIIYLFGTSPDPRRRNLVSSSETTPGYQDVVADSIIREPILPGALLFAFRYIESTYVLPVDPDITVSNLTISMCLFLAFVLLRIVGSLKKSATRSPVPFGPLASTSALLAGCAYSLLAGLSLEAVAATLIIATLLSQIGCLIARGYRNYSPFAVFWLPFALFSSAFRIFSIAISAPIILPLSLAELLLERTSMKRSRSEGRDRTATSG